MRLMRKSIDVYGIQQPYLTKAMNLNDNPETFEDVKQMRLDIIRDLEAVFSRAMDDNQYSSALKAKELMIRELRLVLEGQEIRNMKITDLSDKELREFIQLNK